MIKDQIRVAFIGTGRISDLHAIEYQQNIHSKIVSLCDSNESLAKAKVQGWDLDDVAIYSDYEQLLKNDDIDLVEILVPHHLHKKISLAAFAAGKAVSLQKPMCLNIEDAMEITDAAKQAGVPFKVFENFVFYPPVARAKALIDEGAIGEPLSIRIKSNPGTSRTAWDIPVSASAWRMDETQSGGGPLVFDDGHHKFALAWHFMGQAESVHAWIGECAGPEGMAFDAPAIVSFKFPGNRIGNLEVVYSPDMEIITEHYAQDDRVEITGTKGVIWINRGHGKLFDTAPVSLYRDGQLTHFSNIDAGWESSFVHSTRHYITALREGLEPKLTGEEGCEVLRFALAAQESARRKCAVDL